MCNSIPARGNLCDPATNRITRSYLVCFFADCLHLRPICCCGSWLRMELSSVVGRFAVVALVCLVKFQPGRTQCMDRNRLPQRCIPDFENIGLHREVNATDTCGSPPSIFCPLYAENQCLTCDASNPQLNHDADSITDDNDNAKPTWWQSNTYTRYPQKLEVNLTISLRKSYDVTFIKIKFYSPRPRAFAIYRSSDFGSTFHPWQFYAAHCNFYNTTNSRARSPIGDSEAVCTDALSDIVPLSGGTVTFATLENRRSRDTFDSSTELQDWVTATDLRVVLSEPNTYGDEIYNETRTLQFYYYAVQDLSIGARCKCYGHASRCLEDPTTGLTNCDCQHGTTGRNCELCLPFYRDRPWRRATETDANECVGKCSAMF